MPEPYEIQCNYKLRIELLFILKSDGKLLDELIFWLINADVLQIDKIKLDYESMMCSTFDFIFNVILFTTYSFNLWKHQKATMGVTDQYSINQFKWK
jgi:hypothetical protein